MNEAGLHLLELAWLATVAAGLMFCGALGVGVVLVLAGVPEQLMDVESTFDAQ